jgi:hypothetical protein
VRSGLNSNTESNNSVKPWHGRRREKEEDSEKGTNRWLGGSFFFVLRSVRSLYLVVSARFSSNNKS